MTLILDGKKVIVKEVREAAKDALYAVVADARGVTASSMTTLRREARKVGAYVRIVRNKLACFAVKDTDFECLTASFIGPTLIAFSSEESGTVARFFKIFAKENDKFEIKALAFDGKLMEAGDIDRLATLPTYEEAIVKFMNVIQGTTGKLVRTLALVRDQKEHGEVKNTSSSQ